MSPGACNIADHVSSITGRAVDVAVGFTESRTGASCNGGSAVWASACVGWKMDKEEKTEVPDIAINVLHNGDDDNERENANLYRKIEFSLPHEFSKEENIVLNEKGIFIGLELIVLNPEMEKSRISPFLTSMESSIYFAKTYLKKSFDKKINDLSEINKVTEHTTEKKHKNKNLNLALELELSH